MEEFEKIITAQIIHVQETVIVAALVRDDTVYKIAFMYMDKKEG